MNSFNEENFITNQPPVVGVKENADGTKDYSRAATMEEPGQTKKIFEDKMKPQEWLDQDREKAYEKLELIFSNLEKTGGEDGIRQWFLKIFNPALVEAEVPEISLTNLKSLQYVNCISQSSTEVAGQEINRPILMFSSISEFQNFSEKLQGVSGLASRGMNLPGSLFLEGSPLHKTGLIISANDRSFIAHEIRHSIDPNLEKREGYNRILEELFAYYQQVIVEADGKGYKHLSRPEEGPWGTLSRVIDKSYIERYADGLDNQLSKEEVEALINKAILAIRHISEERGHIEAQRAILKSKTIQDLVELVG